MKDKLTYIFWPYLLTSIILTASYTFLHWLFIIKLEVKINETIVNIFIPVALCLLVAYLVLKKRRKLVARIGEKGNLTDIVILALFAVPLISAQAFIDDETGELTKVKNVSEIDKKKLSRFYKIDTVFIYNEKFHTNHQAYLEKKAGRYSWGKQLKMEAHFVMPLFDKPSDTTTRFPSIWLSKSYYQTVDDISPSNNQSNFDEFIKSSTQIFLNTDHNHFEYLKRLYNNDLYETYAQAIGKRAIIFQAEEIPFNYRTGSSLEFCVYGYLVCAIVLLFALAIGDLNEENLKNFKKKYN